MTPGEDNEYYVLVEEISQDAYDPDDPEALSGEEAPEDRPVRMREAHRAVFDGEVLDEVFVRETLDTWDHESEGNCHYAVAEFPAEARAKVWDFVRSETS